MEVIKSIRTTFCVIVAGSMLLTGCNEAEDRLTVQDTRDVNEETLIETYFQDVDDLTGVVVKAPSDEEYSGGRTATTITIQDERFNCNGITVTLTRAEGSTVNNPKGELLVDFGTTGCTDLRGNIRKGVLKIAYEGRRFHPGSKVVVTPQNYFINGVLLEGIRTSTNVQSSTDEAPRFNVVLANGKATFTDGTFAERNSNITWTWMRNINPLNDRLVIEQGSTANGTTRGKRKYTVTVTKSLVYKRFCVIAIEGIKTYTLDGNKDIVIDYGDGECDKTVSVTVNGTTRSLTIN